MVSGNFIKIAIALLVIVGLYYYVKHKIGERQAHIVNAVLFKKQGFVQLILNMEKSINFLTIITFMAFINNI